MNKIKKITCTALAVLTIFSSGASVSNNTTRTFFSNSITTVAATIDGVTYANSVYYREYYKKNGQKKAYFECKFGNGWFDKKWYDYEVTYFKKCDKNEQSIVNALEKAVGKSSFNYRAKIAVKNKIVDSKDEYVGSYEQNVSMLKLMREGHLIKTAKLVGSGYVHGLPIAPRKDI